MDEQTTPAPKEESARRKALRELIAETCPRAKMFDGEEFDGGIIGTSSTGSVVYSYEKLLESLTASGWTEDEAEEWLQFNTVRSVQQPEAGTPIVVFELMNSL